jgi:hypothetical protein
MSLSDRIGAVLRELEALRKKLEAIQAEVGFRAEGELPLKNMNGCLTDARTPDDFRPQLRGHDVQHLRAGLADQMQHAAAAGTLFAVASTSITTSSRGRCAGSAPRLRRGWAARRRRRVSSDCSAASSAASCSAISCSISSMASFSWSGDSCSERRPKRDDAAASGSEHAACCQRRMKTPQKCRLKIPQVG